MGLFGDIVQMNVGQIWQTPRLPTKDYAGQTVVITGASSGIGLEAAKHIYALNAAHIILACRDQTKGQAAVDQIKAQKSGKGSATIEVWYLDLTKYESVVEFGNKLQKLQRLDVFIANAAIQVIKYETFEGNESSITVNLISTLLSVLLAIPKMQQTSKTQGTASTIVFVGTCMHIFANPKALTSPATGTILQSLSDEKTADMGGRYDLSKLMLLLVVRQLATVLDGASGKGAIVTNYVNPGWCDTPIFRYNDGGMGQRMGLKMIGRTAESGSRNLVYAGKLGSESHGKYVTESQVKPESTWARTDESVDVQKALWQELTGILEKIKPGVTAI